MKNEAITPLIKPRNALKAKSEIKNTLLPPEIFSIVFGYNKALYALDFFLCHFVSFYMMQDAWTNSLV